MENKKFIKNRIFSMLESIEKKTKIMAHHDENIKNELKQWQDGKLKDSYFNLILVNYFDSIE